MPCKDYFRESYVYLLKQADLKLFDSQPIMQVPSQAE